MKRLLLASALLLACTAALAAETSNPKHAIIDMHLHADHGTSRQDWDTVLRSLDEHGVVLAMLSVDDIASSGWDLDPKRFWPGPAFPCFEGRYPLMDPCFEENAGWPDLGWLRKQYESGRARSMGEMLYVYYGIPPADERLEPYWALAEELGIPVGVHTGRGPLRRAAGCCPNFNPDYGNPALLRPVLEKHPRLRIWLMHAGERAFQNEAIALMKDHPNVYAEMSIVNSVIPEAGHAAALRTFIDAGLIDRLMFGSDNMPIGDIVKRIDAVPFLEPDQREAIYCGNAARFLRLDSAICSHP